MPLTPVGRVYKNFPSFMAERVTQHARRRTENYRKPKDDETDDQEILGIYRRETLKKKSNNKLELPAKTDTHCSKRPRTPLNIIKEACPDSDSENSTPSPRSITNSCQCDPLSKASPPNSRGVTPTKDLMDKMKLNSRTPTPTSGGEDPQLISTFHFLPRTRMLRSNSRTSVSIDNVDLWESDSESDYGQSVEKSTDVVINPRRTYDLSNLRRSRSPVNQDSPKSLKVSQTLTGLRREKTSTTISCSGGIVARQQSPDRENKIKSKPRLRISTQLHPVFMPNPTKSTELPVQHIDRPKSALAIPILKEIRINPLRAFAAQDDIEIGCSVSNGLKVDAPVQICEYRTKKRNPSTHDGRRVKFNSLVTVTDGEFDTLDVLRSSQNSAQMYKQKYLGVYSPRNTAPIEDSLEQIRPPEVAY